jgi:hypothetical protein
VVLAQDAAAGRLQCLLQHLEVNGNHNPRYPAWNSVSQSNHLGHNIRSEEDPHSAPVGLTSIVSKDTEALFHRLYCCHAQSHGWFSPFLMRAIQHSLLSDSDVSLIARICQS